MSLESFDIQDILNCSNHFQVISRLCITSKSNFINNINCNQVWFLTAWHMSSMVMLLPTSSRKERATHLPKYDYANEDDIVNKLIDRVASSWYIYWHIVELTFSKYKIFHCYKHYVIELYFGWAFFKNKTML